MQHVKYAFYLVPDFSLLALSCAIDGLRAANVVLQRAAYSWTIVSGSNHIGAQASCGLSFSPEPICAADTADRLVVCGGRTSHEYNSSSLTSLLRRSAQRRIEIGAVSEASFILARAGLFDGRRSTIHWKRQHAYRECFPHLDVRSSLFEIDGSVFSSVGGLATLDLILKMIMSDHGTVVAAQVAENFHHDVIRGNEYGQRVSTILRHSERNPELVKVLVLMEENLETPLTIADICGHANISHRQIDRLFSAHFKTNPLTFYRQLRLKRAKQLLKQTSLSITQIAVASGFSSSSHFAKCFRDMFQQSPRIFREQYLHV